MLKNNQRLTQRQQQALSIAQADPELATFADACDAWISAQVEEVNRHG